jgi:hypothetical protein
MSSLLPKVLLFNSFIIGYYAQTGVDILCLDAEECAGIEDQGYIYINSVTCTGYASCFNSLVSRECVKTGGCDILCAAPDACSQSYWEVLGAKDFKCEGFEACESSTMYLAAGDDLKLSCKGYQACANNIITDGVFVLAPPSCEELPCPVIDGLDCEGTQSCYLSRFAMGSVEKLNCDGDAVCAGSEFLVYEPRTGFEFECEGAAACALSHVLLEWFNGYSENIQSITCEGDEACSEMQLDLVNDSGKTIYIDELVCSGYEACKQLVIAAEGDPVVIRKCKCDAPSPYSCLCAVGLEICETLEGNWNTTGTDIFPCVV